MRVKINAIKLNPENPRFIRDEKFIGLKKSIENFPDMLTLRPIVVDEKMIILGGNMRYRAAKELGHKEINIVVAKGLSAEQRHEFIIKDNLSFGEWDWEQLANEWDVPTLNDWGLGVWDEQQDNMTNKTDGIHVDDAALSYVDGEIKKFEFYIDQSEYAQFMVKLDAVKAKYKVDNNSDAIVKLIMDFK